jgi:hypothetical protein
VPGPDPRCTEIDPKPVVAFLKRKLPAVRGAASDLADIYYGFLQDWHTQGLNGDLLTAAQFGLAISYICKKAGIRIERRGKRVVCVDREWVA